MSTKPDTLDERAIERLIGQVRGVSGARVARDARGALAEIHVVAEPGRSPKQMVRDIESILFVRGGVRVDHRKISLTLLAEPEGMPVARQARLVDIERSTDAHETTIQVTLAAGERRVQGLGRARLGQRPPAQLVGEATVHALNQLLGAGSQVRLEDLRFQPLGQLEVCLSQLALVGGHGDAVLLGISPAQGDAETVAARAVLDAIGRAPHYAAERVLAHGAS